jgi:glutathione synthase
MTLRVAIQMDPIEAVNIDGDTTFALAVEAQARGHAVWVYQPEQMSYDSGRVLAVARPATVRYAKGDHVALGPPAALDLSTDVDVVLMRQDPPFDMAYITAAHLLELVAPHTLVINDPFWVRSSPEKLSALLFADLMPPTLVSRDRAAIADFRARHGEIVIKPLFGNAGAAVFFIRKDDLNLSVILDQFFAASREPVMAQAFLPDVYAGDKRIILVDGEAVGAINRIPQGGDIRSNLAAGGKAVETELSAADRIVCDRLKPMLKERGLVLVGIDVIAGRLTEINVTSPTGVLALRAFSGVDAAALTWDAIERRLAARA